MTDLVPETDEVPQKENSQLWNDLQKLAKGLGVQRRNLRNALGEELSSYWHIGPKEREAAVRAKVTARLEEHIATLIPAKEKERDKYCHVVRVSFNISDDPGANCGDLTDRREWLEKHDQFHTSLSSSWRYLQSAITQIEQSLLANPPDPIPKPRRPRYLIPVSLASVILLVAAVLFFHPWAGYEAPSTSSSSAENTTGNALGITVLGISDPGQGTSVAFPTDKIAEAKKLLAPDPKTGALPGGVDFQQALNAGAYALRGMKVVLELEAKAKDQEVTIFGIRPFAIKRDAPATGVMINMPSQGDSTELLGFDLDASPNPLARKIGQDGKFGGSYFDQLHPTLAYKDKRTFALTFRAQTKSYSFNIAIDYEVAGQKFMQLVTAGGHPLQARATAYLCPGPREGVSDADVQRLNQLRYSAVYAQDIPPGGRDFILRSFDPNTFAATCNDPYWSTR